MKITVYTLLALFAFAGNSVLCRLALGGNEIDASSFTAIRLLSGVIVLLLILKITQAAGPASKGSIQDSNSKGSWRASFMLFLYAVTFSFAYLSLETGTGALILFASVQITMISTGILSGDKLYRIQWLGLALAFIGLVYLVMPGLEAPSLLGFMLMSASGVAWGFYTLAGQGSDRPLSDTSYNFLRTLPFAAILLVVSIQIQHPDLSQTGIMLAILSGGIASGVGYTIWYMALAGLSTVQASILQLLVPVIAALGGILFADEVLSLRFVLSSLMILGGVLMVLLAKRYYAQDKLERT